MDSETRGILSPNSETKAHPELISMTPHFSLETTTCFICLESQVSALSEFVRHQLVSGGAVHSICLICVSSLARYETENGVKLTLPCPFPGCQRHLDCHLAGSELRRLRNRHSDAFIKAEIDEIWKQCPRCMSENSFHLGKYHRMYRNRFEVVCSRCNSEFCLFCREFLSAKPSYWPMKLLQQLRMSVNLGPRQHSCQRADIRALADYTRFVSPEVKPCPKCFRLIHRFEGCRNMQCNGHVGCGTAFCFDCLTILEDFHICRLDPLRWKIRTVFERHIMPSVWSALNTVGLVFATVARLPLLLVTRTIVWSRSRFVRIPPELKHRRPLKGFSFYSVPLDKVMLCAQDGSQQGGWGEWDDSGRCFAARRIVEDAVVYLHSHDASEACWASHSELHSVEGVIRIVGTDSHFEQLENTEAAVVEYIRSEIDLRARTHHNSASAALS